ncbi:RNA polymerase I-specific transcription initiation factor-domain-containing protein [Aspergillus cavernicola]|uniref:RNA polymerase I-specific transcription initiation factor-domain-containing protein n=1 Tax=Aspergillus cavernicola TaxID=176166 RepID=A0ABR4I7D4_9EURO
MSSYSDGQSRHSSVPPSAQPYRSLFGGSSQDVFDQDRYSNGDGILDYAGVGATASGGPNTEHEETDDDRDYRKGPSGSQKDHDLLDFEDTHVNPTFRTRGYAESSFSPPPYRPNRFHGPADLWLELTRNDREIVEALEETRARDLAAHLYNAHVFHPQGIAKLAKEGTNQPDEGEAKDYELGDIDLPNILEEWTAWPMPSDEVPRTDERLRRLDDDKWTFRMKPDSRPSAELEECITSFLLKTAKGRSRSRRWASPTIRNRKVSTRTGPDGTDNGTEGGLESDLESADILSNPSTQKSDTENGVSTTEWESEQEILRSAKRPVFQVDEDESRQKLRPLARNVITQFEKLLMGLDRFHGSPDSEGSQLSRSRSRGRKRGRSSSWASDMSSAYSRDAPIEDDSEAVTDISHSRPPSSSKRRTEITPQRSQSRGRKRTRRASQRSQSGSTHAGGAHTSRRSRLRSTSADSDVQTRLTDWKDVVGIASMVDLPPAVLRRATQRLSSLLGEDIMCPTFFEERDRQSMKDVLKLQYPENSRAGVEREKPTPRSGLTSQLPPSRTTFTRKHPTSAADRIGIKAADKAPPSRENSTHKGGNLFCPFKGCRRHKKGFSRRWNLNQHLRTMHPSYRPGDNKSQTRSGVQSGYESDRSD